MAAVAGAIGADPPSAGPTGRSAPELATGADVSSAGCSSVDATQPSVGSRSRRIRALGRDGGGERCGGVGVKPSRRRCGRVTECDAGGTVGCRGRRGGTTDAHRDAHVARMQRAGCRPRHERTAMTRGDRCGGRLTTGDASECRGIGSGARSRCRHRHADEAAERYQHHRSDREHCGDHPERLAVLVMTRSPADLAHRPRTRSAVDGRPCRCRRRRLGRRTTYRPTSSNPGRRGAGLHAWMGVTTGSDAATVSRSSAHGDAAAGRRPSAPTSALSPARSADHRPSRARRAHERYAASAANVAAVMSTAIRKISVCAGSCA